jgi:hypothetical protein
METGYQLAAAFVEYVMGTPQRMADDASKLITAVSGKKDPMLWLRDRIAEGVKDSSAQASKLLEMKDTAAKAEQMARTVVTGAEHVLASLEKVKVPTFKPEKTELGNNAVANFAESVVDGAKGLGADAANAVIAKIQTTVDQMKATATKEVGDVKAELGTFAEFMQAFQAMANEQTGKIREQGAKFAAALAKCKNVEDVLNMLLKFGTEILGADGITVEDIKKGWHDIRHWIDDGFKHARATAAGTDAAPQPQPQPAAAPAPTPAPAKPATGAAASP